MTGWCVARSGVVLRGRLYVTVGRCIVTARRGFITSRRCIITVITARICMIIMAGRRIFTAWRIVDLHSDRQRRRATASRIEPRPTRLARSRRESRCGRRHRVSGPERQIRSGCPEMRGRPRQVVARERRGQALAVLHRFMVLEERTLIGKWLALWACREGDEQPSRKIKGTHGPCLPRPVCHALSRPRASPLRPPAAHPVQTDPPCFDRGVQMLLRLVPMRSQ
jgi:hypothetical protein